MRKRTRLGIDARLRTYLAQKAQAAVVPGVDLDALWKNACRTKTMGRGRDVLRRMVGGRERCMFCEDSRGTDIDHYWPKKKYPVRCFDWDNYLYVCAGCNRQKGQGFPVDVSGNPLLINPLDEEPWLSLYFDEITGNITPKWDSQANGWNPRGVATVDPKLLPLNVQAVIEGRKQTYRRLVRSVTSFMRSANDPLHYDDVADELKCSVKDNLDYGLAEWFFLYEGAALEPFASLQARFPAMWGELVALIR